VNVLISSVSRKVSLVRAWKKAAHERGGNLIVADMDWSCIGMYEGDGSCTLPAMDTNEFVPLLKDVIKHYGITLVVPTRDEEVREFSAYEIPGVRFLTPGGDAIRICQDKILFNDWCKVNGFKTPAEYLGRYPAFIRARRGSGSNHARRVVDDHDLKYFVSKNTGEVLIQEYVRAPEYSVDVFSSQAGKVICAVPRERVQIVGGESWVTKTVRHDALRDEAVRLAETLGLQGHSVLQCFDREGEILWIEVNPRFGGASALGMEAGCKSPDWILDELEGKSLPTPLVPYEENLTMLRYTQDRFVR
jgi:carbamoyl-phosphate synthase large subunit